MNKKLALALLLAASTARAQDKVETTEATGQGAITGDLLAAKEQAKDDALRNCVQQVAGTFITAATETDQAKLLKDNVYSHSQGYVKKFTVLEDRQDGNTWVMKLRCDVSESKLEEDMLAFGQEPVGHVPADALTSLDRPHTLGPRLHVPSQRGMTVPVGCESALADDGFVTGHDFDRDGALVWVHPDDDSRCRVHGVLRTRT